MAEAAQQTSKWHRIGRRPSRPGFAARLRVTVALCEPLNHDGRASPDPGLGPHGFLGSGKTTLLGHLLRHPELSHAAEVLLDAISAEVACVSAAMPAA